MATTQGDPALLEDPVVQGLLRSTLPARMAYVWRDGSPRVVPIWFHWDGEEFVLGSPPDSPKVQVLPQNSRVALTIDTEGWPPKVLQIRGTVKVEMVEGVPAEYAAAARRYFGEEQGNAWVEQLRGMFPQMARISVRPEWVGFLDFEQRLPSAIEAAMPS